MILVAALLLAPLLGAALAPLSRSGSAARAISLSAVALQLLVLLLLWLPGTGIGVHAAPADLALQLPSLDLRTASFGAVSISLSLGVDAPAMLVLLMSVPAVLMGIASTSAEEDGTARRLALMLLVDAAVVVACTARDLLIFAVALDVVLVLLYVLMAGSRAQGSPQIAARFLVTTQAAALIILIVTIALAVGCSGSVSGGSAHHTFNLAELMRAELYDPDALLGAHDLGAFIATPARTWAFGLLAAAFALLMAVPPLHRWYIGVAANMPAPAAIVAGCTLRALGGYGLLRCAYSLFPDVLNREAAGSILMIAGAAGALYAGTCAIARRDLRSTIAYAQAAHAGMVLFGLGTLSVPGLVGGMTQLAVQGVVGAALFALLASMQVDGRDRAMRSTGGAAPNAALARWLLLFMLLACAGLPPLGGWWPMTLVLSAGLAGGQTMLPGMAVLIGWALITGAIGRCAVDLFRPIDHAAFAARRPEGGRSMLGAAIVVAALIAIAGVAPATLAAPVDAEATRLLEFVATHSQRAYISTIARPLDAPAQPVNATFP